jgi:hypothetical protein
VWVLHSRWLTRGLTQGELKRGQKKAEIMTGHSLSMPMHRAPRPGRSTFRLLIHLNPPTELAASGLRSHLAGPERGGTQSVQQRAA